MNTEDTVIKTQDAELMDELRDKEQVYVAGVKYDVDGYSIIPESDADGEIMVGALERVFKDSVLRCPSCERGEKIQVEDDRFANGYRWECNYCSWKQEV